jgi:hypothetical protein
VTNLDPSGEQTKIGLDHRHLRTLGAPKRSEIIACPVCNHEWSFRPDGVQSRRH